ncbi:MAG: YraN family protein [bacterium]
MASKSSTSSEKKISPRKNSRGRIGRRGEEMAEKFLRERGCEILSRNYRASHREIDLVARDGNTLVFVEVKTRRRGDVIPQESVGPRKREMLISAAYQYLADHGLDVDSTPCRFDVIAITLGGGESIEWIPDAFMES